MQGNKVSRPAFWVSLSLASALHSVHCKCEIELVDLARGLGQGQALGIFTPTLPHLALTILPYLAHYGSSSR